MRTLPQLITANARNNLRILRGQIATAESRGDTEALEKLLAIAGRWQAKLVEAQGARMILDASDIAAIRRRYGPNSQIATMAVSHEELRAMLEAAMERIAGQAELLGKRAEKEHGDTD